MKHPDWTDMALSARGDWADSVSTTGDEQDTKYPLRKPKNSVQQSRD